MDSDDVRAEWGRRVAKAREALGFSQRRLAEICGVTSAAISRIERGEHAPRDGLKMKIAGALGKTVDELFSYPAVRPPFPQAATA